MRYEELKTAAEQAAFELGEKLRGLPEHRLHPISRLYAHTHQYVLLPNSEFGFRRLSEAFLAGAGLASERKISAATSATLTEAQHKVIGLINEGYTVRRDRTGESDLSCAAYSPNGGFWRLDPGTVEALVKKGVLKATEVSTGTTYTLAGDK